MHVSCVGWILTSEQKSQTWTDLFPSIMSDKTHIEATGPWRPGYHSQQRHASPGSWQRQHSSQSSAGWGPVLWMLGWAAWLALSAQFLQLLKTIQTKEGQSSKARNPESKILSTSPSKLGMGRWCLGYLTERWGFILTPEGFPLL